MEASSSPQSTTPPLILEEPVVFIHPPIFAEQTMETVQGLTKKLIKKLVK